MAKLTDEEFTELQTKYAGKRLAKVDLRIVGTLVWRAPTKAEHSLFRSQLLDGESSSKAYENLFLATVVYPEPAEVLKLTQEYAGLTSNTACIKCLNVLNGQGLEEEKKD